ncbi:Uma2 family endonuclease [Nocardia sp. NPDC088792]|uniref:Uma2 family endonuclease n=1 Tax=Nocardia sp. NPDC088792 TaxID=3364332 RepID=UPI003817EA11
MPISTLRLAVDSDVVVRFPAPDHLDGLQNVVHSDVVVYDSEYDRSDLVHTRIQLIAEVASEDTVDMDSGIKRVLYAHAGIPAYLIVQFDRTWEGIDRVEEYRLDWSGSCYVPHRVHRTALVLDTPVTLAVTFESLDSP